MAADDDSGGDLDPRWVGVAIFQEHWHFHRRLLERYGIVLAPGEFSRIVNAIESGRAVRIIDHGGGKGVYSVRVQSAGERVFVLADGRHLITAMTPSRRLNGLRRRVKDRKP